MREVWYDKFVIRASSVSGIIQGNPLRSWGHYLVIKSSYLDLLQLRELTLLAPSLLSSTKVVAEEPANPILFVCFSTKAIHLEATSELSTAAFLATLRRFIGRRGVPRKICSDNAINFVGAKGELEELYTFIRSSINGSVGHVLTERGIEWSFIPFYSPHMGGIWEAGVKSCKYHLKIIMGNFLYTFEELSTLLIQIEACLNSRSLSSMSSDPSDLQPLTPGHFLVGGPLTSLPEIDLMNTKINRLDRWELLQRSLQDFWKRWAGEYVANLQGRVKWRSEQGNLKPNDLVLLKEDNLPVLKWKIGRVLEMKARTN